MLSVVHESDPRRLVCLTSNLVGGPTEELDNEVFFTIRDVLEVYARMRGFASVDALFA